MDEDRYRQVLGDLRSPAGKIRRKGREYEISRVGWTPAGANATEQMPETWEPIGADIVDRLVLEGQINREDIIDERES